MTDKDKPKKTLSEEEKKRKSEYNKQYHKLDSGARRYAPRPRPVRLPMRRQLRPPYLPGVQPTSRSRQHAMRRLHSQPDQIIAMTATYQALFPQHLGRVNLVGDTLTAAHDYLRGLVRPFGYRLSGLTSTASGGHTEASNGGRPIGVTIRRMVEDRELTPDELIEGLLDAGFSFSVDECDGSTPYDLYPANPKPLVDPQPSTNGSDLQDEPLTRRVPPPHNHRARKRSVNINQMRII